MKKITSKLNPNLQASYDYSLPESQIATFPMVPKDHSRLLVYNRYKDLITHTRFDKLEDFLPKECAIILNDTKVIRARIFGKKDSGGKVELLLNAPLFENQFNAYIRGRVKVGTKLIFQKKLEAKVEAICEDGLRIISFTHKNIPIKVDNIYTLLDEIGHLPLPPYMKREECDSDRVDYQTIFAKNRGAVAAPTASLHFTPKLLEDLKKTHPWAHLTLHVGAGTFKPVEAKTLNEHVMHSERYNVPKDAMNIINSATPILAVGTTVTRTIEQYKRTNIPNGECNLFLNPNNPPIRTNHLLTNFHLPRSTLIMLVASFVGLEKTLELYEEAVLKKYRFFSYGDAMLII